MAPGQDRVRQDRVVVLYSHPLLGEGLGKMLAAEPGLVVSTVNLGNLDALEALDAALAANPDVVVFEEGGPVGVLDVLRRSGATVVIDVDITSSTAWTLQRHALRSAPEEVLGAIRAALAERVGGGSAGPRAVPPRGRAVGPGQRAVKVPTAG